jgi:hypothetical protein
MERSRLIRRKISEFEIRKFVQVNQLEYFETSAKENINVNAVFTQGVERVIERIQIGAILLSKEVSLREWHKNGVSA